MSKTGTQVVFAIALGIFGAFAILGFFNAKPVAASPATIDYDAIMASVRDTSDQIAETQQQHGLKLDTIESGIGELMEAVELLKPRPLPEVAKVEPVEEAPAEVRSPPSETPAVDAVAAQPTAPAGNSLASTADDYNGPLWSYPGDIDSHLTGPNHGFTSSQLAGLTHAQKVDLHSHHHQSGQATVSRSLTVQPPTYQQRLQVQPVTTYQQNCPGGVCPTNRSYSSGYTTVKRGLFGRIKRR